MNHHRREFFRAGGLLLVAALIPGLAACSGFEPRPFATGAEVKAPLGCEQLLQRDPKGDC